MGMYDMISFKKLPPAAYNQHLFSELLHHNPSLLDRHFQTKDLARELAHYIIQADGGVQKIWTDADDIERSKTWADFSGEFTMYTPIEDGQRQSIAVTVAAGRVTAFEIFSTCAACRNEYRPKFGHACSTALISPVNPPEALIRRIPDIRKELEVIRVELQKAWDDLADLRQPSVLAVLEERHHQQEKGYTAVHDDAHVCGELAKAAACYAFGPTEPNMGPLPYWPFKKEEWHPSDNHRKNCIKAAAMLLAEIERIDRANARKDRVR